MNDFHPLAPRRAFVPPTRWAVLALLATVLPGAAAARSADCLVNVMGKAYIDGSCDLQPGQGGSFRVQSGAYFALVSVKGKDLAEANWSSERPDSKVLTPLGEVRRSGGCWENPLARVCAWEPGQRPRTLPAAPQPLAVNPAPVAPMPVAVTTTVAPTMPAALPRVAAPVAAPVTTPAPGVLPSPTTAIASTATLSTPVAPAVVPIASKPGPSGVGRAEWIAFGETLQAAVRADDPARLAALLADPLRVNAIGAKPRSVIAAEFPAAYAEVFSAGVKQAILKENLARTEESASGFMIGDGQAWVGPACVDKACSRKVLKIIAVNL